MSWNLVGLCDVPLVPWRNGGGVTRVLAAWPDGDDWLWRMSVAEVTQDGPFSRFDGVQRWFAVLSGAGVRLHMPDGTQDLSADSAPVCFDGALPVECRLRDGATQDFNLMLRRERASGCMRRVSGASSVILSTTQIVAAYPVGTPASVRFDDEIMSLEPDTLLWRQCAAGARLQLQSGPALWMEINL